MGDDPRTGPAKNNRPEVMIRVMMGEDQPFDRLRGDRPYGPEETFAVSGAGQCVYHHNALRGHDEPRVRATLRPSVGITQNRVDSGREGTERQRWRRCGIRASSGWAHERKGSQKKGKMEGHASRIVPEGTAEGARGQAAVKAMLTDCLKEPPLLSVQTMVRGASLSAFSVKLTTGSRLMPEVQANRAISSAP
jgi:hypothetical protein